VKGRQEVLRLFLWRGSFTALSIASLAMLAATLLA